LIVELLGEMVMDMAWIKAGVGLKGTFMSELPITGNVTMNSTDNTLSLKYDIPREPTQLILAKIVPMTTLYLQSRNVHQQPFSADLKEIKPNNTMYKVNQFEVRALPLK